MGGYVGRSRPAARCECPPVPPTGRGAAGMPSVRMWLTDKIDERAAELGLSWDEIAEAAGFTRAALRRMQDDPMFPFLPGQGLLLERVLGWPPGRIADLLAEGQDRAVLDDILGDTPVLEPEPEGPARSWIDGFEVGAARFLTRVLAGDGAVFLALLSLALVPLMFLPGTRGVTRGVMVGADVCARVALGRAEPARLVYTPVSGWR